MSLTIWGLLAFLPLTFTDFGPTRRPPPELFRPLQSVARPFSMNEILRPRGPNSERGLFTTEVYVLCDLPSRCLAFGHTTSNHVVQPRSPTTSSTHRPSPNIDDNQDLLTTSLDRGRPRMGEAWSNEPFSSNVKSRLGLFDTSFENSKASRQHSVLGLLPKYLRSSQWASSLGRTTVELQSQRSFQIERTCKSGAYLNGKNSGRGIFSILE